MLLLFTTFLLLLAGISLAFLVKRLVSPKVLDENQPPRNLAAENYRPLFEPTDEDLRQFEAEEKAQLAAKQAEDERLISEEKLVNLEKLRQNWRESPNKATTIELLYSASQTENGEAYLETANIVLETWQTGNVSDLAADDLAHLLDSHFWLLPTHERTPGVSFRIQQEIAGLRREPQTK
jgi:hypothetical protein